MFRDDPKLAQSWRDHESRRKLSSILLAMRKESGLTQRQLADKLNWKQPQVARLESATGPWPNRENLRAYTEACGRTVGLVFAHPEGRKKVHIDGTVAFGGPSSSVHIDQLAGTDIKVVNKP
jgi:transcriptional regulator with XRE-family HTH domain